MMVMLCGKKVTDHLELNSYNEGGGVELHLNTFGADSDKESSVESSSESYEAENSDKGSVSGLFCCFMAIFCYLTLFNVSRRERGRKNRR